MVGVVQVRPYRGVDAADRLAERRARLLEAGLDILGSDSDLTELTVRGICRQAGVTARYFYESFTDKDDLVASVYDWVIADIAAGTQAAVATARPEEQGRAAMTNIVRTIVDDPRVGRLLFGSDLAYPVLARKRVGSRRADGDADTSAGGQHISGIRIRERQGGSVFRGRRRGADHQRLACR